MNLSAEDYNEYFVEKMAFNTAFTSLLLLLGLMGNSVVLYFYAFRMPRTEDRYFIPYLAVADILACAFGSVFSIVINFYRLVFVWENLCKCLYFFTWCTSGLSAAMLLVIAINRYLKVCRPNGVQMAGRKRVGALLIVFVLSILTTLPLLYFMGQVNGYVVYNERRVNVTTCGLMTKRNDGAAKLYFFIEFSLSLIIMICTVALYVPIGISIYKRFRSIRNSKRIRILLGITTSEVSEDAVSDSSTEARRVSSPQYKETLQQVLDTSVCQRKNSRRRRVRHNFTSMFVTIVLFYVLSYVPTFVLIIIPSKDPFGFWYSLDDASLNVLVILKRAFIVNHVVNPFVYGYFDLHFRTIFKSSLSICKKPSSL